MNSENHSASDPDPDHGRPRHVDGDPSESMPIAATVPSAEGRSGATDLAAWDGAEIATARRYADASRAASTQRAYTSDWRRFDQWCMTRPSTPCRPPHG